MKSILQLALLFFSTSIFAQQYIGPAEKYWSVYIGAGPRIFDTQEGTFETFYTDDSPAADILKTSTVVEDSYSGVGINFGFRFGKYEGLSHDITFDLNPAKTGGFVFTYCLEWGIGMELGDKPFFIRPGLNLGFSNYSFEIGELKNGTGFIQIGQKQFTEDLEVQARSGAVLYGPSLELNYLITDNIGLYLNASYDISNGNDDPRLVFSGNEGEAAEVKIEENDDNPIVEFNGEKVKSLPYEATTLRLSVGASYYWNRD